LIRSANRPTTNGACSIGWASSCQGCCSHPAETRSRVASPAALRKGLQTIGGTSVRAGARPPGSLGLHRAAPEDAARDRTNECGPMCEIVPWARKGGGGEPQLDFLRGANANRLTRQPPCVGTKTQRNQCCSISTASDRDYRPRPSRRIHASMRPVRPRSPR
jgi:hypothetical protein